MLSPVALCISNWLQSVCMIKAEENKFFEQFFFIEMFFWTEWILKSFKYLCHSRHSIPEIEEIIWKDKFKKL